eukprot:TRINITY_DN3009_c0_g1_i1.p1 TRINITY_DN3009_c0_g1~~TRINITY_DN3009_c0_g1_i1.p1  ORF type:complete len:390 (+),score=66.31 TRINITY_DN3009_c0_g1_i1:337-1506(+)
MAAGKGQGNGTWAAKCSGDGVMPPQSSYVPPRKEENAQFAALQPGEAVVMRGYAPGPVTTGGQALMDNYDRCMARPQGTPFAGAIPQGQPRGPPLASGGYGGEYAPAGFHPPTGFGIGAGGAQVGTPAWTPQHGYGPRPGMPVPGQWGYQKQENPEYAQLRPGQSVVMQGYGDRQVSDKGRALMDNYEKVMQRPTGSFPNAYAGARGTGGKGGGGFGAGGAPGTNLRLANLPLHWSDEDLLRVARAYGAVTRYTVWKDPTTNVSKGFGLVQFADVQAAEACTQQLTGQMFAGGTAPIQVTVNIGGKGKGGGVPAMGGGSLFSRGEDASKEPEQPAEDKPAEEANPTEEGEEKAAGATSSPKAEASAAPASDEQPAAASPASPAPDAGED